MTDSPEDELLAQVRQALSGSDDASDDVVDMIMTGYDITSAGMLIAELIEESISVPVRSGELETRFVTFEAEGLQIRVEVLDSSVLGEVDPPAAGTIELQQRDSSVRSDVLDSGAFEVSRESGAPFRLVYTPLGEGPVVATAWILP